MRKLFEIKCNVVAFIKSLFSFMAVSRKYDDWYYLKGRKISAYDWQIVNSRWMRILFGTDSEEEIKTMTAKMEMEERKLEVKGLTLHEDGIWYNTPGTFTQAEDGYVDFVKEQLSTSHPFF
jgi:hypothetical protein